MSSDNRTVSSGIFSNCNEVLLQKFLEDVLNVQIDSIELLLRKNKMTDDGSYVEFDFRCKILGQYVIIEMQQFYKQDVIKRFYMYTKWRTLGN